MIEMRTTSIDRRPSSPPPCRDQLRRRQLQLLCRFGYSLGLAGGLDLADPDQPVRGLVDGPARLRRLWRRFGGALGHGGRLGRSKPTPAGAAVFLLARQREATKASGQLTGEATSGKAAALMTSGSS